MSLLDSAAPRAVFDRLPTHRHRVRFHVRDAGAWMPVTWGQFALQIRGVARWLVEHEVEPGEHVAIYAPNSVAWASAALGAQTAGAVFVPIYPASTHDQVAYIVEHAEIRYVFVRA
jgi:long-subunit acyl-CoA synthetase (AMP-forming)